MGIPTVILFLNFRRIGRSKVQSIVLRHSNIDHNISFLTITSELIKADFLKNTYPRHKIEELVCDLNERFLGEIGNPLSPSFFVALLIYFLFIYCFDSLCLDVHRISRTASLSSCMSMLVLSVMASNHFIFIPFFQ